MKIDTQKLLIASTDTLVENKHFFIGKIKPVQLGRKAVAVAVSDLAAMGSEPKFILSSIGFNYQLGEIYFKEIIEGFKKACIEFNVSLVGGNLSGSDTLFIDITALGQINPDYMVKRSGAEIGDDIYVTGTIGDSALGYKIIDSSVSSKDIIKKHLEPVPRIEMGKKLSEQKIVNSMIDVSDGLYLDLSRITVDFNLGAIIELEKLPLSKQYLLTYSEVSDNKFEFAVTGGEDYELLFTANPEKRELISGLSLEDGLLITRIGKVTDSGNILFIDARNDIIDFENKGFVHFS
ncbi:MAG: thiamine-phosphate kinase [Candidatus Dadabacteria bacterium]|nr:thiamine-phosphate kinase [Candidatus Dadabacteria bacterium]NIQ16706.1 thiamine-phosphate kinase [Candidatus Dadabacteria bacterium]